MMVDTLKAETAFAQLNAGVASVTLQDIKFDEGRLWRPRYESLFDYEAVPPGLNLVPSFQVRSLAITSVEITLELKEDEPFEFQTDQPVWMIKDDSISVPLFPSVNLNEKRVFTVDLETFDAKVGVFRILCKGTDQTAFTGREQIEGGLFLTIVNVPSVSPLPGQSRNQNTSSPEVIKITGAEQGRLKYSIFRSSVYTDPSIVSVGLEPEPAFRIQQANTLQVGISLEPDNQVFMSNMINHAEVALTMNEPSTKPGDLNVKFRKNPENHVIPEGCDIHWISSAEPQVRDKYIVTSFSMDILELTNEAMIFLGEKGWDGRFNPKLRELIAKWIGDLEKWLSHVGSADPTIIDTPKCITINGATICSDGVSFYR